MKFKMAHFNFNVKDLDASLAFYKEHLHMKEVRRSIAPDGSFIIVFLEDEYGTDFNLELTWLKNHTQAYDLGDEEFHLAFHVEDYDALRAEHKAKGLMAFDTEGKPYHFIVDPDGYWLEFMAMH